jgi:hypothetical protein
VKKSNGFVFRIPHLGDAGGAPIGNYVIAFAESIRLTSIDVPTSKMK